MQLRKILRQSRDFVLLLAFILTTLMHPLESGAIKPPLPGEIRAVLKLQKGAELAPTDLKKLLQSREVRAYEPQGSASWILVLRQGGSFDVLEKQIRRNALPVTLDWSEEPITAQK